MPGRLTALAAVLISIAVTAPATASADDWPRRLFVVAHADDPERDAAQDFLERPGGAILIASGSGASRGGRIRELRLSGRLRTVVEFPPHGGRSAIGLLADSADRFLAVDGWGDVVRRVHVSGSTEPFAGTGRTGFSGDGGPAVAARLALDTRGFLGLSRTADGAVVLADVRNGRLRRVRPDGVIETIAGIGPPPGPPTGCAFAGDGGPATQARLCQPSDVLATADGGLLVADTFNGRIRRIALDGTITTISGDGAQRDSVPGDDGRPATDVSLMLPTGLAQLKSGDLLFSDYGRILRVGADGRVHTLLRLNSASGRVLSDFSGRRLPDTSTGIAATAEGGLLIGAGDALYLAPRHTRRTLVGIRGARVRRGSVALDLELTRRALATVTVRAGGRTIVRSTRTIRAGRRTLSVRHAFVAGPHSVRVAVHGPRGARAADRVVLYLGTRLGQAYVRRFADGFEEHGFPDRCRRFSGRRVDCALKSESGCDSVASYTLRRTGVIWRHEYGCKTLDRPFHRAPHYTDVARPVAPGAT
jgi:hypothetical protein